MICLFLPTFVIAVIDAVIAAIELEHDIPMLNNANDQSHWNRANRANIQNPPNKKYISNKHKLLCKRRTFGIHAFSALVFQWLNILFIRHFCKFIDKRYEISMS